MKKSNRLLYFLLLCLVVIVSTNDIKAQKEHFRLHYVINVEQLDTAFSDNNARGITFKEWLEEVAFDTTIVLRRVDFKGTASPDGGYEFNVWLCTNRLRTFKEYVRTYIDLPDSIIFANVSDIPWDGFREKVADTTNYVPHREEVLRIIDKGPNLVPWFNHRHIDYRLLILKKMYRGQVWEVLKEPILSDLRYGEATFYYHRLAYPITPPSNSLIINEIEDSIKTSTRRRLDSERVWVPRWYIKSNLIGWAFLSTNIAVEVDVCNHLTVTLPIYYCGWDWFKSTIKFRNFSIQPELRYWFRRFDNDGFFVGAHFGLTYYNFAFDGEYRYQDFRGRTPAIGGGLSFGYRIPISTDNHWRMEFTVGAGVYPTNYSIFENTPDVKDGRWQRQEKDLYIGLDQVAITFMYSLDMPKFKRHYTIKGVEK